MSRSSLARGSDLRSAAREAAKIRNSAQALYDRKCLFRECLFEAIHRSALDATGSRSGYFRKAHTVDYRFVYRVSAREFKT